MDGSSFEALALVGPEVEVVVADIAAHRAEFVDSMRTHRWSERWPDTNWHRIVPLLDCRPIVSSRLDCLTGPLATIPWQSWWLVRPMASPVRIPNRFGIS